MGIYLISFPNGEMARNVMVNAQEDQKEETNENKSDMRSVVKTCRKHFP